MNMIYLYYSTKNVAQPFLCHSCFLILIIFQGLVVVDVYSEWSGPCSAMTNFLKKIKLEVNDDLLHYAMAKSDTIPQLEVFRGSINPLIDQLIYLLVDLSAFQKVMHLHSNDRHR